MDSLIRYFGEDPAKYHFEKGMHIHMWMEPCVKQGVLFKSLV